MMEKRPVLPGVLLCGSYSVAGPASALRGRRLRGAALRVLVSAGGPASAIALAGAATLLSVGRDGVGALAVGALDCGAAADAALPAVLAVVAWLLRP